MAGQYDRSSYSCIFRLNTDIQNESLKKNLNWVKYKILTYCHMYDISNNLHSFFNMQLKR